MADPRPKWGPSVVDGQIRYLSVSQLERFDVTSFGGCERKWYFRYVERRKEPQSKASYLGEQIHEQIAHYLRTGEEHVLGDIARSGLNFLPAPGPDLIIEEEIAKIDALDDIITSTLYAGGVPFIGKSDLLMHREGLTEVCDWKTTSQIENEVDDDTGIVISRGYAKTAEELAKTWQMTGYAKVALTKFPQSDMVRLSHGYFQTRGQRKALKRSSIISKLSVNESWDRAGRLVDKMKYVAGLKVVQDVEPNLSSCSAYGGCPHRSVCPLGTKELISRMFGMEEKNMGIMDKWKSEGGESEIEKEKASLLAEEASILAPETAAALAEAKCVHKGQIKLTSEEVSTKRHMCACGADLKVKPQKMGDGEMYALVKEHEVGKGDPPSKAPKKANVGETQQPGHTTLIIDPAALMTPSEEGITLYLDSSEDGVFAARLETYVADICSELCKQFNVTDIRCGSGDSLLGFGRWRGALAAAVKANPPPAGSYSVRMADEVAAVVAEALIPLAERVIRGHR